MTLDRKSFLRMAGCALAAIAVEKAGAFDEAATTPESADMPKRLAMVIDLRQCSNAGDCDLCVRACHREHNVPEIEDKRHEVKWIWKEPFRAAFAGQPEEYANAAWRDRPALVLCNHCDRPPCVRVCPTHATWRRDDGVVMMDAHRCIGCRYCMAACPYGSRSFNWVEPRTHIGKLSAGYPTRMRGVVEKCSFCPERLAQGRIPACVEACTRKAIRFGDLSDPASEVRAALNSGFALRRKPELGTVPEVYYLV